MTRRSPIEPADASAYVPARERARAGARPGEIRIQRQTIASMTVEALRERILRGDYPRGEPLRHDALVHQLGVSWITVCVGLRQLEAEGLVTFSPHRGAIVSSLSLAEIEEVFDLRSTAEPDLLRRALPHLTTEQFDQADEVLDSYAHALQTGDVAKWGELNWRFHATLYAPAER